MTGSKGASAPASKDETLLQGRYRIGRCLGSGGMGDVYLAEDLRLGRLVAVKSLKQEFCKISEVRKRIERECVMHAQLGAHPNIITLYDRIDDGDQIHLIIEYVDGTTLKEIIEKARLGSIYLTWRESVSIACQLLEALAKIHAHDIVHRDVKPANIMITQSDTGAYTAKLMDFGIARLMNPVDGATMLTRQGGSGPGTPIYMSPEQIAGTQFGPLSPATDIYAMGVVLFQMLAKRPPFHGTITDIFHGHLNAAPPPIDAGLDSSYPVQLTEVVHQSLAKQPCNRFASAVEFRRALRQLTKAHGVITTLAVSNAAAPPAGATMPMPPAIPEPITTSWLFRRRDEGAKNASRTVVAVAIVLAAVAAVVLGNFLFFRSLTTAEPPTAAPQQTIVGASPAASESTLGTQAGAIENSGGVSQQASSASVTPEMPTPVTMEAVPESAVETPVDAAPKTVEKPAPRQDLEHAVSQPSSVEPPDNSPAQPVPPQRTAPKEEPRRTPIPIQTPVPPDLSVPTHESEPFSESARRPAQEMTPVPRAQTPVPPQQFAPGSTQRNENIFQDVQVNKKPAIKVN